ncbi:hypothetical protein K377_07320 [Streptomyces sp. PsTaAH-137]|nr:hypothetical protein K377_07320 [Streptomyces sp. PsTaAH-137]
MKRPHATPGVVGEGRTRGCASLGWEIAAYSLRRSCSGVPVLSVQESPHLTHSTRPAGPEGRRGQLRVRDRRWSQPCTCVNSQTGGTCPSPWPVVGVFGNGGVHCRSPAGSSPRTLGPAGDAESSEPLTGGCKGFAADSLCHRARNRKQPGGTSRPIASGQGACDVVGQRSVSFRSVALSKCWLRARAATRSLRPGLACVERVGRHPRRRMSTGRIRALTWTRSRRDPRRAQRRRSSGPEKGL